MYMLCDAMRWNHLPVAGGIYDQHPRLIEDFLYIFSRKAEFDKAKAAEEKRKQDQQRRQQHSMTRRRR